MDKTPPPECFRKLLEALKPIIEDDFRAFDGSDEDEPSMLVTVGSNSEKWGWQTGDFSFLGGAYGYPHTAQVVLYRDSDCAELANDLVNELEESIAEQEAYED